MKKKLLIAGIVSFGINSLFFLINLISANIFHVLPLVRSLVGGECIEYIGFGVYLLKLFPMTYDGGASVSYSVSLHLMSYLIPFFILLIIVLLIEIGIDKLKSIKK